MAWEIGIASSSPWICVISRFVVFFHISIRYISAKSIPSGCIHSYFNAPCSIFSTIYDKLTTISPSTTNLSIGHRFSIGIRILVYGVFKISLESSNAKISIIPNIKNCSYFVVGACFGIEFGIPMNIPTIYTIYSIA